MSKQEAIGELELASRSEDRQSCDLGLGATPVIAAAEKRIKPSLKCFHGKQPAVEQRQPSNCRMTTADFFLFFSW